MADSPPGNSGFFSTPYRGKGASVSENPFVLSDSIELLSAFTAKVSLVPDTLSCFKFFSWFSGSAVVSFTTGIIFSRTDFGGGFIPGGTGGISGGVTGGLSIKIIGGGSTFIIFSSSSIEILLNWYPVKTTVPINRRAVKYPIRIFRGKCLRST